MKYLLASVSLVLLSSLAQAHSENCKSDAEKLCTGVEKGEGRIMQCLRDKQEQLSEGCKADINVKKEAMKEVANSCEGDIKQHCGDVEAGKGRIAKCLHKNKAKLSEPCKAEMKEQRGKFRR